MIAPLLLAAALSLPHAPVVLQAGAPAPIRRHPDLVRVMVFTYCDAHRQPSVVLLNQGRYSLVVSWLAVAAKAGVKPDIWSSLSIVGPGQFEGWQTSATVLQVTLSYDDDGIPVTETHGQACP
jgi:hypothetical protein